MESETIFESNVRSNVMCVTEFTSTMRAPASLMQSVHRSGDTTPNDPWRDYETKECREAMSWYNGDNEWVSKVVKPETMPGDKVNNWMFDCWTHHLAHPAGVNPDKVIRVNFLVQPSSGFTEKLQTSDEKPGRLAARYRLLATRAAIHLSLDRLPSHTLNVLVGGRSLASFLSEFRWFNGENLNLYTACMSAEERKRLEITAYMLGVPAKVKVLEFREHVDVAMDLVICGFGNGGVLEFDTPLHVEKNLCGYIFQGVSATKGPLQDMILGWALTPAGKIIVGEALNVQGSTVLESSWDHDGVGGVLNIPPPLVLDASAQSPKLMVRLEGNYPRFGVYVEGDLSLYIGPYGRIQCDPIQTPVAGGYHIVYLCGETSSSTWRVLCPCGVVLKAELISRDAIYGKIVELPIGVLMDCFDVPSKPVYRKEDLEGPCVLVDPYRCGDGAFVFKTVEMLCDVIDHCFICLMPIYVSNHPERNDVVNVCSCQTTRVLSPGRRITYFVTFGHRAYEGKFIVAPLAVCDPMRPTETASPQLFDCLHSGSSSFIGNQSPPERLHLMDVYEMYQRAGTLLVMLYSQPQSEYWRHRAKIYDLLVLDNESKMWDALCSLRRRLGKRSFFV